MTFEPWLEDPRARVLAAIEDIRAGKMVILVDDEDRENEGDLVMAAEKVTPEAVNFMAVHGRGLICLPLTTDRADALALPLMVRAQDNASPYSTAFTVSIEASKGVTTGISAADRAHTILTAIGPDSGPSDLVSPGHVFPLRARPGGVLVRSGQTEGSVDLSRLAGLDPSAVICEIMNDDGTMSRLPELLEFGRKHELRILSVADLIAYRLQQEPLIELSGSGEIATDMAGGFKAKVFTNRVNGLFYLALTKGEITPEESTLVRVHSGNVWGDAFGALRRDGGTLLSRAMKTIEGEGRGVVLYILKPFNANNLLRKLADHAEACESRPVGPTEGEGGDPYPTELRDYGIGAQVLAKLGVGRVRLITDSNIRLVGLEGFGLQVEGIVTTNK